MQSVQPKPRPRKDWIQKKKVTVIEKGEQPSKQLGISNDDMNGMFLRKLSLNNL